MLQSPAYVQTKKVCTNGLRSVMTFWHKYGHTALHYSLVPGIFAYGLYQAGELTLDPIALATKILIP